MIKVTYIFHDGFFVETPSATIVFDYWMDGEPDLNEAASPRDDARPRFLQSIRRDRPLYVVVSHHHKDHFVKSIFTWTDVAESVRFVISNDVARFVRHMLCADSLYRGVRPAPAQVTVLKRREVYSDSVLTIRAFGSTDIGNSYMVDVDGIRLFHAGDLNAWIWKDESTEKEVREAMGNYQAILRDIAAECGDRIDLAMFPVDSRIGTDYWEGASVFVRKFNVGVFVPMHFGLGENREDADRKAADACRFSEYANPERGLYVALQRPYSSLAMPTPPIG